MLEDKGVPKIVIPEGHPHQHDVPHNSEFCNKCCHEAYCVKCRWAFQHPVRKADTRTCSCWKSPDGKKRGGSGGIRHAPGTGKCHAHEKLDERRGKNEPQDKNQVTITFHGHPDSRGRRSFSMEWWDDGFHLGPRWVGQCFFADPTPHIEAQKKRGRVVKLVIALKP